eukprot:3045627-Rhodomonas_salina.1
MAARFPFCEEAREKRLQRLLRKLPSVANVLSQNSAGCDRMTAIATWRQFSSLTTEKKLALLK